MIRALQPKVSVVIPAFNAAATLLETLQSLTAQVLLEWEAIVVDDGSTDGTFGIADEASSADPRFRVVSGAHAGVGAARNEGVRHATGQWLLFLDADDWIAPDHLVTLLAEAEAGGDEVVAVCCACSRVDAAGTAHPPLMPPHEGDVFALFASHCATTIHSTLVLRSTVLAVGGFDTSLAVCEDWDLWQKVARTGGTFRRVEQTLAYYRMSPGSATTKHLRFLQDGLVVLRRAHAPSDDPLYAAHAEGASAALLPLREFSLTIWVGALAVGGGGDPRPLVALLDSSRLYGLDAEYAAGNVFEAAAVGAGVAEASWPQLLVQRGEALGELLDLLQTRTFVPEFKADVLTELERRICDLEGPEDFELDRTARRTVDVGRPLPDQDFSARIDRAVLRLVADEQRIGSVVLPVIGGRITAPVLADAVAAHHHWALLGRSFARTRYSAQDRANPWHHDQQGWEVFLQVLWDKPGWPASAFYQDGTQEPPGVVVTGQRVDVEVAGELPSLVGVKGAAVIRVHVGGAFVGEVAVRSRRGRVTAQQVRAAVCRAFAVELAIVSVREGLLGKGSGVDLREELQAAAVGRTSGVSGPVVERRSPELPGAPARFADLPGRDGARISYRPDVPGRGTTTTRPAVRRRRALRGQAVESTFQLPVFMYHRIATEGSAELARYRVPPEELEHHLVTLKGLGFRGVSADELTEAVSTRAVPEKRVVLTFDDAYEDFAENAWPLLKKHGFASLLFVPTGHVGGANDWELGSAERVPLLDWAALRQLRDDGCEFGSHTVSHRPLSALGLADLTREAVDSRVELEERLSTTIRTVAYPYGRCGDLVNHVFGAAGYVSGFSCVSAPAQLRRDQALALPRFEIGPGLSETMIRNLVT